MNVFVLCTGRCGSTTFIRAAGHITNFSASHESRSRLLGASRLAYPEKHIEADCRLAWLLGRLEHVYGDAAVYVHLTRNPDAVAKSFAARWDLVEVNIARAYWQAVHMRGEEPADRVAVGLDYVESVTRNIDAFLRGKSHVVHVSLDTAKEDFARFWDAIGAEGDKAAALAEWDTRYNAMTRDMPRPFARFARALTIGRTLLAHRVP
jgi:hypothetical protein